MDLGEAGSGGAACCPLYDGSFRKLRYVRKGRPCAHETAVVKPAQHRQEERTRGEGERERRVNREVGRRSNKRYIALQGWWSGIVHGPCSQTAVYGHNAAGSVISDGVDRDRPPPWRSHTAVGISARRPSHRRSSMRLVGRRVSTDKQIENS